MMVEPTVSVTPRTLLECETDPNHGSDHGTADPGGISDMDDTPTRQVVAAEVLGTFVLVLFGCGSVVFWGGPAGDPGLVPSTTAGGRTCGLALMVMTYAVGRISGAHFNPAVSVGAALGGRLPWHQVPVYVAAQLGGAILGAAVLFGLLQGFDGFSAEGNLGQNG